MAMAMGGGKGGPSADINVTPLIDVLLVLLIIFMVITPMLQKGVSVDLAKVNNPKQMPDADKEDALVIAVMRNGDIFLGNDRITGDQLTNKIKDRISNRVDKRVYLRADARAKYKSVVDVVDNIRAAGVDDLGLETDQKKQTPPGTPQSPTPGASGSE